jgi:hypothetical protein
MRKQVAKYWTARTRDRQRIAARAKNGQSAEHFDAQTQLKPPKENQRIMQTIVEAKGATESRGPPKFNFFRRTLPSRIGKLTHRLNQPVVLLWHLSQKIAAAETDAELNIVV